MKNSWTGGEVAGRASEEAAENLALSVHRCETRRKWCRTPCCAHTRADPPVRPGTVEALALRPWLFRTVRNLCLKRALLEREGVDVEELERLGREHVRYIGSRTTHIFCFPTCKDANRIRESNRVPFRDADDALEHGYRPCRTCQPVAA